MRLTNTIRNAFIASVMHEVPKVDYKEALTKIVSEDAVNVLPEPVRNVYKSQYKQYVAMSYVHGDLFKHKLSRENLETMRNLMPSITIPGYHTGHYSQMSSYSPSSEAIDKLVPILEKARAQIKQNNTLETKLRSVVYGATTVKQLAGLLPEFEKYLPKDVPSPSRTLPVAVNLVSEFTQAGWPKSGTNNNGVSNASADQKTLF